MSQMTPMPTSPDFNRIEAEARALRRAEMTRLAEALGTQIGEWHRAIGESMRRHHEAWLRRTRNRRSRVRGHELGMPV